MHRRTGEGDASNQCTQWGVEVLSPGCLRLRGLWKRCARGAVAMNLGDGLKLETQILNGKTRLILAPYGVQEKSSKPAANRGRASRTTLNGKPQTRVLHAVQNTSDRAEQPVLKPRSGKVPTLSSGKPAANVLQELENKKLTLPIHQNVQPTKPDAGKGNPVPRKVSIVPKQRPQHKPVITAEDLRESLVCLTQEQFQQILMTINQNNQQIIQQQSSDKDNDTPETEEENITSLLNSKEEDNLSGTPEKNDPLPADQPKDTKSGSFFSTLGEREEDKSLQEAKKAQWKRELDEQVALKKKIKEVEREETYFKHSEGRETLISERTPYSDLPNNTPLNDFSTPDSMFKTQTCTETTNSSPLERASSFSSPELPAAIRSAFILGEAAPLDHPFSAVKRQQQKKWLEELNKQREEIAQRKLLEKKKIQETEQHELWAVHFDSFKKKEDHETPVPPNNANSHQSEITVSQLGPEILEQHQFPATYNLEQEWPNTNRSGEEDAFNIQKVGHLRTMTALLDPAQIEERDRKRQKQLEHQKAIAAQVEEKRRRKQLEDEQRQREEQEEERRLAKEREQMQKQFEEDTLRQKQKEEVQNLKTRELYQSVQRAQEEAQRIKQEQRMRHLVQKGHDVSHLQKNASGDSIYLDLRPATNRSSDVTPEVRSEQNTDNPVLKQCVTTIISPRKDTAVQTDDLDFGVKANSDSYSNGPTWRQERYASPDIPIEFTYQQSKAEQQIRLKSQRDKIESSKENSNNDVYEPYARTEKQGREPGRKPDWNRNQPHKKFVPASERYPKGLQKQREESKVKRQMELLHLVEKNSSNNLSARKGLFAEKTPLLLEEAKSYNPPEEMIPQPEAKKEEMVQKVVPDYKRSDSPPVPAVKNRMHQAQRRSNMTPAPIVYSGNTNSMPLNISPELGKQDTDRPPSSQFVPYVRTKEIYYLDPDAPMSRPSTHDPQYRRSGADQEQRQVFSSDHARDPLLNPNVIRNKDRQQAILRGLSELRRGLLQKQRELESGLMPDV
ncbi:LOW QUALITY PROTEIN: coiled-coil domain-containing protein 66 [Gastrophryne carolinensis]